MSDDARAWARRQLINSIAAKSVLNALAGYADADGLAWPKLSTLAETTGMSVRHVRRQLERLERDGFIRRQERLRPRGGNTSNLYKLAMPERELIGRSGPDGSVRPLPAPGGQSCPPQRTSVETSSSDELSGAHACEKSVDPVGASMQPSLAGRWTAVPSEMRGKILSVARKDDAWAGSYLDPAGVRLDTQTLHPATAYARGKLSEYRVRQVFASAGLAIGEPVPSAQIQAAIAATIKTGPPGGEV